jgi:hypothetical protein
MKAARRETLLNHKRAVILLISVGGGLRLPLMEGDKIRAGERKNKAVYYWFPLGTDGASPDLSRSKRGNRSERYLHPRFFEELRLGNNLMSVRSGEYIVQAGEPEAGRTIQKEPEPVQPDVTEKRTLLLRLPVRGLPPGWH